MERFIRSEALLGETGFARLAAVHVAVFGVGGVGSWCAEALLRTGVRRLTLVDDDTVAGSNINRQRQAVPASVGKPKAAALRDVLLGIAPDAEISVVAERYTPENAERFLELLDGCDFAVDAIDSVECKAHLIASCTSRASGRPVIFSSMGAALRTDPTKIRTAPFRKVTGDGLAKALRNRFRKSGAELPGHLCVYSEELPVPARGAEKGSVMPVTCAFGMALASLVIAAAGSGARVTEKA